MSSKNQAVQDIKKLALSMKGLIAFADELESIGSIEQAANEANARLEKYKKDEEKARASFESAQSLVKNAEVKSIELVNEAIQKAEALKEAAKEEAASIKDSAQSKYDEAVKAGSDKKAQLDLLVQALRSEVADLQLQKAESEAKLNDIKKQMASIREMAR